MRTYTPADAMEDAAELTLLPVPDELYALTDEENQLLWGKLADACEYMRKDLRWCTHGTGHQIGTYNDALIIRVDLTKIYMERIERRYGRYGNE